MSMPMRRYGWPPARAKLGDYVTCERFWGDARMGKVVDGYTHPRDGREWLVVDWKWLSHPGLHYAHHTVEDLTVTVSLELRH